MFEKREETSKYEVVVDCGSKDVERFKSLLERFLQDSLRLYGAIVESIKIVGTAISVIFTSKGKDSVSAYGRIKDSLPGIFPATIRPFAEV